MPWRSDFAMVEFNSELGNGTDSVSRNFFVSTDVLGFHTGYLMIQAEDVENPNHRIAINGDQLPGQDLPVQANDRRNTWMEQIPAGYLQAGNNTLTFTKNPNSNDVFRIDNVVVHWRETD